jgi:hypothetical protein
MSWKAKSSICTNCGDILIVTQAIESYTDYWWYCASKVCKHHSGEQLGDQEFPSFYQYVGKQLDES